MACYLKNRKKEGGYVLVVGLIFLLVATTVSVVTLQNSNISYQISSNKSFSQVAFHASETGRIVYGDALTDYMYDRNWGALPTQLSILDKDTSGDPDLPMEANGGSENIYDSTSLLLDASYSWTGTGNQNDINANIFVLSTPAIIDSGSGAQQLSGYEGLGKGAGAGGGTVFFEIRSLGFGNSGANAITASEFRAKIQ